MGHNSMLVAAGEQTLITSKPMLTMTTPAAVDRLKPLKRDCYNESEAHLRYFEREMGYFYNLNNCFFNYALHRIRKECNCKPFFMPSTSQVSSAGVTIVKENEGKKACDFLISEPD